MKKKLSLAAFLCLVISLGLSCTKHTNPSESDNEVSYADIVNNDQNLLSNLKIKTDRSEYKIDEITSENLVLITATLENVSSDTFYTNLGDGYDSRIEQDYLLMAKGSDGYLEKYISHNKLERINLNPLYEGTRVIRILPSKKYKLTAGAYFNTTLEGKFRLKVNYYRTSKSPNDTLKDISNIFFVKK